MPTIDDAQAQAYSLANPSVPYVSGNAITKKWLALKAQGIYIGVPIGPEIPLDDGTVAQAFTAGCVLHWKGGDDVEVV